jgi:gamma-glutamylcyclotransferase (GGCT)/AIG2-like uncharacterized protein YtfP
MTDKMTTAHRLASYGTLAPGKSNHAQVEHLKGRWLKGTVRGTRTQAGWGQWIGYPGFVVDPSGDHVEVDIFESQDLPAHWDRLDTFEGEAYQRISVQAQTETGPMDVSIYTLKPAPKS